MTFKRAKWLFTLTLPIALAACGGGGEGAAKSDSALENVAAPAGKTWSKTVVKTEEGGFRMGNPDAPLKLVEYASFSCHVCRDFEQASAEELKEMVDSGRLSFEFRSFVRGSGDIPPSLLASCSTPEAYFPLVAAWFGDWDAIMKKGQQIPEEKLQAMAALPQDQQIVALAQEAGMIDFFAARGISSDKAKACLSDKKAMETLLKNTEEASKEVTGTPAIFLNGKRVEFTSWVPVKNQLRDAGVR